MDRQKKIRAASGGLILLGLVLLWGCAPAMKGVGVPQREPQSLAAGVSSLPGEASPLPAETPGAGTEGPEASAAPPEAPAAPLEELSGSLTSFQVQVGDRLLAFPMTYEALTALGWEQEDGEITVRGRGRTTVWFRRNGLSLGFTAYNGSVQEQPCARCQISGLSTFFSQLTSADGVFLPGGLLLGRDGEARARELYGEPDVSYSVGSGTYYRYETENAFDILELRFDGSGVLTDCELDHPEVPEDAEPPEAQYVAEMGEYEAPESMGDSLLDRIVELDGDLYRVPVPVRELVRKGWTVESETERVTGGNIAFITLTRNGAVMDATVRNETVTDCAVEDAWVQDFSSADVPEGTFAVSGGISRGMTEEALLAVLNRERLPCIVSRPDGRKRYSVLLSSRDWEDYCDIVVEDGLAVYIQFAYRGKPEE